MKALKSEAAYFYPENGERTAIMVFEMQGSVQLPAMVEPLFQNLGAPFHVTPMMNGEDLQRGFKEAGMKYGLSRRCLLGMEEACSQRDE
jgi:hypothetical protein